MGQGQVTMLREEHIVVQLSGQVLVHLHRYVVELDTLRRAIVRPNDGCVTPAGTASEVASLQHRRICYSLPGQVVGSRQTVHPAADNDDVVSTLHPTSGPHTSLAKE